MENKLDITVNKTVEALARINRFVEKYGQDLSSDQLKKISSELTNLNFSVNDLKS